MNNAGIGGMEPLLDTSVAEVERLFATNVFGALRVAKAFAPTIAGGTLVDVHSVLSWIALGGAYSASKAAFWSLTNSLRLGSLRRARRSSAPTSATPTPA